MLSPIYRNIIEAADGGAIQHCHQMMVNMNMNGVADLETDDPLRAVTSLLTPQRTLGISIFREKVENGTPVSNIAEAESRFIASAIQVNIGEVDAKTLFIHMTRENSLIAVRTRRGAGNTILISESTLWHMREFLLSDDEEAVGRWRKFQAKTGPHVYVGPIPDGQAVVAYVGTSPTDNSSFVCRGLDGLVMLPLASGGACTSADYSRRIHFTLP